MNERLANMFMEMVRIDSESGAEQEFIAYLKVLLTTEFQAECDIDEFGNLIASVPAKNLTCTEPVFFSCHADTTVNPGKGIEPLLENEVIRSKAIPSWGPMTKPVSLSLWGY